MNLVFEALEFDFKQPLPPAIFVFVHGWKHSSNRNDSNYINFVESLRTADTLLPGRDVVGVYVGWRAKSIMPGWLQNLSFWNSTESAQRAGSGGVTELILLLDRLSKCGSISGQCDHSMEHSPLAIIGHSLGATVLLEAINEVLLDRLLRASPGLEESTTNPLGHGVFLLNPAVDALHILEIKEAVNNKSFSQDDLPILHILSSEADKATISLYPLARSVGNMFSPEETLVTSFGTISESTIRNTTIGNFPAYWTHTTKRNRFGRQTICSVESDIRYSDIWQPFIGLDGVPYVVEPGALEFKYRQPYGCGIDYEFDLGLVEIPIDDFDIESYMDEDYVPYGIMSDGAMTIGRNDPVRVIHTDSEFISSHNDIFNPQVLAYIATTLMHYGISKLNLAGPKECYENSTYNLQKCLSYYLNEITPASPNPWINMLHKETVHVGITLSQFRELPYPYPQVESVPTLLCADNLGATPEDLELTKTVSDIGEAKVITCTYESKSGLGEHYLREPRLLLGGEFYTEYQFYVDNKQEDPSLVRITETVTLPPDTFMGFFEAFIGIYGEYTGVERLEPINKVISDQIIWNDNALTKTTIHRFSDKPEQLKIVHELK